MKQNRWTSPVVWAAIVAQLITIGILTGFFTATGMDVSVVEKAIAAILQLCVVLGVLNNPTDSTGV